VKEEVVVVASCLLRRGKVVLPLHCSGLSRVSDAALCILYIFFFLNILKTKQLQNKKKRSPVADPSFLARKTSTSL